MNRRFVLTGHLSNFSIWLFFFPYYIENFHLFTQRKHFTASLWQVGTARSCTVGPRLRKIRGTGTHAVGYVTVDPTPGQDRVRFHHATQNSAQVNPYKLLFLEISMQCFWTALTTGN